MRGKRRVGMLACPRVCTRGYIMDGICRLDILETVFMDACCPKQGAK